MKTLAIDGGVGRDIDACAYVNDAMVLHNDGAGADFARQNNFGVTEQCACHRSARGGRNA